MILGFKQDFVPKIQAGTKIHTIRSGSRWRAGQTIHFFQNVRQPGMHKFHHDDSVKSTQQVSISILRHLFVDGRQLTGSELELFAVRDGFSTSGALLTWFEKQHGLPFAGQLIHWTNLIY
jgi:hypothetical protein